MILWKNGLKGVNRMKIEDKNKRKMFFASVNRTGRGEVRRMSPARQSALEYGRNYKPYGGIYEQKHTDASVQE